jgi:amino acid transporter
MACGLVLIFGILNFRGIKLGAWAVNVFTLAKIAPLVLFIAIGIFYVSAERFHPFWTAGQGTLGHAIFFALWPLQGFEIVPLPAGETNKPQRAVPVATIGSLLFVTLIYVLIQMVCVGVFRGLAGATDRPLADAAAIFLGPVGATVIALGAVVSMIGYTAGNALGSPRFLSALAEDKCLPPRLSAVHPRFFTPSKAILLTTGITFCAALLFNFQQLVILSNLAVICQYLSTCSAVIWLRRTKPEIERTFKIPCGSLVAAIGCAVSLWLIRQVNAEELILAGAVLMAGFIIKKVIGYPSAPRDSSI